MFSSFCPRNSRPVMSSWRDLTDECPLWLSCSREVGQGRPGSGQPEVAGASSDKALLHVGAEQEGVDQPRFDQLLLVGSLDAVRTTGRQPPQSRLEDTQPVRLNGLNKFIIWHPFDSVCWRLSAMKHLTPNCVLSFQGCWIFNILSWNLKHFNKIRL